MSDWIEEFCMILFVAISVAIGLFVILNLVLFIGALTSPDQLCHKKIVYIIPMTALGCYASEEK